MVIHPVVVHEASDAVLRGRESMCKVVDRCCAPDFCIIGDVETRHAVDCVPEGAAGLWHVKPGNRSRDVAQGVNGSDADDEQELKQRHHHHHSSR